ncbi:hypothetical protein DD238_007614 [Peronospora effusa]|uniref:Uncharacterized protein n=1 Tax=Peronospora effusa TaxID=542832 RepID=A0A3M6VN71_9STRA|nr:hypothetical protein DD238_007614 [Peronospora effusa]
MTDPARDAKALSLSDEDMAGTLDDFCYTSEPLLMQCHRLLSTQQQQQQQESCNEPNHEMSQFNSLPTIGCPSSNDPYHTKPMLCQRDEEGSMLVNMNAPSTSNDDWHRRHQCAIQDQLEQQRDLRMQINQQHQLEKQMQQQHMKVQRWQQEKVQRQQVQAQRFVERILPPRYSSSAGRLDQTGWTNDVYTLHTPTPSFCSGGDLNAVIQQPGQLYNARSGCSEQLLVRTTTAPVSTHSYMSDYNERSRSGVLMDRNDGVFALHQDPQIVQAHLQAQNPYNFAVYRQGRHDVRLLAETQAERTKVPRMQTLQRYTQQEPLQPQPYYPAEINQRSRQEKASGPSFDDAFLDEIMEGFFTSAAPAVSNHTTVNVSAGINVYLGKARKKQAVFNANPSQFRIWTGEEVQIEGQMNVYPRLPIPPSGATVVPGVSLARQAVRLVTMRDILNYEDGSSNVDLSTSRPYGKQKRIPPRRKMLRNKASANRQKMSHQQSVRNYQQLRRKQPAGTLLLGQSASDVTTSAFISTARPSTPMHLESRAARASEQTACITNTRPSKKNSESSTPPSQLLLPAPVVQLSTEFANPNIAAYEEPNPGSSKMAVASTDMCNSSTTYQLIQKHTRTPPQDTAVLEQAVQPVYFLYSSTPEVKRKTNEPNAMGQTNVDRVCDSPMDKAFGQHRRQQSSLNVSVSLKAANNVQSPNKLDVVDNGKDAKISRKTNRAKRPFARVIPLAIGGQKQQIHGTLPTADIVITRKGSIAATAVAPATDTHTPLVFELARMENRTVVIFCKRDFMRYQAVKIWRKYQEQLKKHEEWREVRVAGKRTRYLNSRYDGETRRAKRKAYAVGKATKKPS